MKCCLPPVGSTTLSEAKDQAAEAALNGNTWHPKGISRHVWLCTEHVSACVCNLYCAALRVWFSTSVRQGTCAFLLQNRGSRLSLLQPHSLTLEPTQTLCSSASQWALHSAVSLQMVPASDQCTETNAVSWMWNRSETPLNEKPVICHSQSHPLVKTNQKLHLYENCVPFITRCLFWTKCAFLR